MREPAALAQRIDAYLVGLRVCLKFVGDPQCCETCGASYAAHLLREAAAALAAPVEQELPARACWNCSGYGVLVDGLGENDATVWVPPYPCPVCQRSGLTPIDFDGRVKLSCFKCGAPADGKFCSEACEIAFKAGAASLPATRPTPQDVQRKFERSQQRWGNLKARIEAEIVSLENPCLSTQQRNQYANGVARLRWVLREMWKSPDVLAEVAEVIQQLRCPHCGTSNYQPNERCVNHGELEHQHSGRGSTSQHRQPEGREQDGGGVRAAVEGRGAHDRGGDVHARREGIDHAEGAEAHSKVEASLPATRPTPEPLEHIINGWREIGEEVERIVLFMTQAQRDDLLPDWFEPRLKLMLSKRAASFPQEPSGTLAAALTDDVLLAAIEAADPTNWEQGFRVYYPNLSEFDAMRAVLLAAQTGQR